MFTIMERDICEKKRYIFNFQKKKLWASKILCIYSLEIVFFAGYRIFNKKWITNVFTILRSKVWRNPTIPSQGASLVKIASDRSR